MSAIDNVRADPSYVIDSDVPSLFVVALLHSNARLGNDSEQQLLDRIKQVISSDPILKDSIHLISIDNKHCRDILRHNKFKRIINWPMFVIRTNEKVTVYPLEYADVLFKHVYDVNNHMTQRNNKSTNPPILPPRDTQQPIQPIQSMQQQIQQQIQPMQQQIQPMQQQIQPIQPMQPMQPIQQIQSIQPIQPMQQIQPIQPMQSMQPMQQQIQQQIQPMQQPMQSMQTMQQQIQPTINNMIISTIPWNYENFIGPSGKEIYIQCGDSIRFKSSDDEMNNVVEATSTWNVAANARFDYRDKTSNEFEEIIQFPTCGEYYFVSSLNPQSMRLKVIVVDQSDVLDGLVDVKHDRDHSQDMSDFPSNDQSTEYEESNASAILDGIYWDTSSECGHDSVQHECYSMSNLTRKDKDIWGEKGSIELVEDLHKLTNQLKDGI